MAAPATAPSSGKSPQPPRADDLPTDSAALDRRARLRRQMWQQTDVTLNLNGTAPKTARTDTELADLDKAVRRAGRRAGACADACARVMGAGGGDR